jgi:DNA polymerase III subunit delta'
MEFQHFLGNEKIKAQLSALVDGGRLPHAVVLEGESGLGKRTLAGELAAALVCRGEHRPCDSCPQCHKARAGVHPDILVYAPEGGARSFHKKTVDQIVGDVYMTPNEADYKIYILVNAHLMSVQAQNAILKVLEEPPAYVRFILTVENKSALLPTVLSRSVVCPSAKN